MRGKKILSLVLLISIVTVPVVSSSVAHAQTPREIFAQVSPAIVYITKPIGADEQPLGSGFIVDSSGVIVTNYHVIKGANQLNAKLKNGQVYPVEGVIYSDVGRDVCILKINGSNLPTVSLGNSESMQIGDAIYCIGNPLGLAYSFSDGMLSGKRELNNLKWLQFTAPTSPGNSGGPVINSDGEVVGMVTWQYREAQNLNFALAISEIKPYLSTTVKESFQDFVENTVNEADFYIIEAHKRLQQANTCNMEIENERMQFWRYSDEAGNLFKKAVEISPNYATAHEQLAMYYFISLKTEEAIVQFEKVIEINPDRAEAYHMLWIMYMQLASYYGEEENQKVNLQKAEMNLQKAKDLYKAQGNNAQYHRLIEGEQELMSELRKEGFIQ